MDITTTRVAQRNRVQQNDCWSRANLRWLRSTECTLGVAPKPGEI